MGTKIYPDAKQGYEYIHTNISNITDKNLDEKNDITIYFTKGNDKCVVSLKKQDIPTDLKNDVIQTIQGYTDLNNSIKIEEKFISDIIIKSRNRTSIATPIIDNVGNPIGFAYQQLKNNHIRAIICPCITALIDNTQPQAQYYHKNALHPEYLDLQEQLICSIKKNWNGKNSGPEGNRIKHAKSGDNRPYA